MSAASREHLMCNIALMDGASVREQGHQVMRTTLNLETGILVTTMYATAPGWGFSSVGPETIP